MPIQLFFFFKQLIYCFPSVIVFGEKEVSVLSKHYEAILEAASVKISEVEIEWSMLKLELYNR